MELEELSPDSPDKSVNSSMDDEDGGEVLPGFRFHPTDEELVGFYLRRKTENKPLSIDLIRQVDIYKYDPWDLPKVSTVGEKEWYFFCIRGRKYRNSVRPNRVTGSGFWKATGIDKPIYSPGNRQVCIGLKKSLVYYRGSAGKGTKTDWMMHEFRLAPSSPNKARSNDASINNVARDAEVWTICRILRRVPSNRKYTPTIGDIKNSVSSGKDNNSAGSTSKSSSHDSGYMEQYLSFGESSNRQHNQINEHARVIISKRSYAITNPTTSFFALQEPISAAAYDNYTQASFWNNTAYGEQPGYDYGSWDELRSVVDGALEASFSYNA